MDISRGVFTLLFLSVQAFAVQADTSVKNPAREVENNTSSLVRQASQLIIDKKFFEAEKILRKLENSPLYKGEANFYLGLATLTNITLNRRQAAIKATNYFKASAKAGFYLSLGEWADYPVHQTSYCDANWTAAGELFKSKQAEDLEPAANLLRNIIAVDVSAHSAGRELGQLYLRTGQTPKAIELYQQILEAYPGRNQDLYSLNLDYLDLYLPEHADRILNCLNKVTPDSLTPLEMLLMARSHFVLGHESLACSLYDRCLDRLDAVTAGEILRDALDILFVADRIAYSRATTFAERRDFFRRLWRSRDLPTGLSYNGRLAEHYRRLIYAKTYLFSKSGNGYDDRGSIYIKHGEPDKKVHESGTLVSARTIGENQYVENESWLYYKYSHNFIFHFARRSSSFGMIGNLIGAYRPYHGPGEPTDAYGKPVNPLEIYCTRDDFDPFYGMACISSSSDRQLMLQMEWDIIEPAMTLGRTTETYNPYQGTKPLDYYYYTADFLSRDPNSRFYLYYGLPVRNLKTSEDSLSTVNYECALHLYDRDWKEAAGVEDKRMYQLNPAPDEVGKGSLVIDRQAVDLPPGPYHLVVRVKDLNSDYIGLYRDSIQVTRYELDKFNVSQILLATDVNKLPAGQKPGKFTRGELDIMTLPSRTFRRDQKVFVYCEIYYLNADSLGRKNYNIDFSINADLLDKSLISKIISPFGRLLGQKEQDNSITMTFAHEQEDPEKIVQQEYISIDISESPPGKYSLQLNVTDTATGETVGRDEVFYIVKPD
ncbi:MAG: GWxTD domain-containing protein [Candidatus Glassbacteria bacterium]